MTDPLHLIERDRRHVWHPYTQHATAADPLPVVAATGARLTLADGRELLDGISSWWTCLHGHGHPRLVAAARQQMETLDHVLFAGCTHEPAVALAEELLAVAPEGLQRVFYSDDGSTAVEVALKMAAQRWALRGEQRRRVFVALEGGYHGDTFGAMAVGDPDPFFASFQPWLFQVVRVPAEADALARGLTDLGDRAAGVILEPLVQGAAGMRMHAPALLTAARELCTTHRIPLIADEVMTGFGRTGHLFACQAAAIAPDLLCLAKGLTGGTFPLAATLATEEIFQEFLSTDRGRMFFHGHSFTAHPVGCAIARESLRLCEEQDVPARLSAIGQIMEAEVAGLRNEPLVKEIRRTGGILAVELSSTGPGGYLDERLREVPGRAADRGVLLRPLGPVIYLLPPSCVTDDEARRLGRTLREVVTSLA